MERGRVGETQQECDLAVTEPVVREVAAGVLIAHLVEQSAEGGAVLQALQRLLIARSRPSRRRSSANVATTKVNRIIPFQNGKAPYRKRSIAESSRTNAGEQPHQREQPDPELGVRRADAERVECARRREDDHRARVVQAGGADESGHEPHDQRIRAAGGAGQRQTAPAGRPNPPASVGGWGVHQPTHDETGDIREAERDELPQGVVSRQDSTPMPPAQSRRTGSR